MDHTTPLKLAYKVAEIEKKTLRLNPHRTTKITLLEAHMGQKLKTPVSNIATTSSVTFAQLLHSDGA